MLYSFFWAIPRFLNFMFRRFGTLCSFFIDGVSMKINRDEIVEIFIQVFLVILLAYTTHEDGTDREFRNVGT